MTKPTSTTTARVYGSGALCAHSGAATTYAQRRFDGRGKAVTARCACGRLVALDSRMHLYKHLDGREAAR